MIEKHCSFKSNTLIKKNKYMSAVKTIHQIKQFAPRRAVLCMAILGLAVSAGVAHANSGKEAYGPYRPAAKMASAAPDKLTIQSLISDQLDAIRERDADLAFALTTGTFHEKFDSANEFMSDMRFSYRPIYNHKTYRFLDQIETETGGLVQRVEVTYARGEPATVIYRLQRNPDGAWAISSFTVLAGEDGQDI